MIKSSKKVVRNLLEICAAKGIEYVIVSPGSRNAPLNISFNEDDRFKCISVPDERVAAFIALGIGQQTQKPAVITCTSGTAALNYAPAIAEAYYQQIPMLVVTADRPKEWTHQGNGQTINQTNIFDNYIKKSYDLPVELSNKNDEWFANRMMSEAVDQTINYGTLGPVHINMPFREPLYGIKDYAEYSLPKTIQTVSTKSYLTEQALEDLKTIWDKSERILILVGLLPLNHHLNDLLGKLTEIDKRVVVLTEVTANLHHKNFCPCIDRLIDSVEDSNQRQEFKPDLLITIGHSIVSKKIKAFFRPISTTGQPLHCTTWHIGQEQFHLDTMQSLTHHIPASPNHFFEQFLLLLSSKIDSEFQKVWKQRDKETEAAHYDFLMTCEWSDLKAFDYILEALPYGTNLQSGNSSAVRYTLLFNQRKDVIHNSNRGVAGIDGCTSTAIGAAIVNNRPTTIISGDISFFYDSNAFWNSCLPENLRVILMNNGGGSIFRIIKGPSETNQLEDWFETHHNLEAVHIANMYQLNYYRADSEVILAKALPKFYEEQDNKRPAILEIVTPRFENDKVLKRYFKTIKDMVSSR